MHTINASDNNNVHLFLAQIVNASAIKLIRLTVTQELPNHYK